MVLMKNKILFPLLFVFGLSIGACSSSGSSFDSGSNGLDSSSNNQRSSSSGMSFPSYSSSFEEILLVEFLQVKGTHSFSFFVSVLK